MSRNLATRARVTAFRSHRHPPAKFLRPPDVPSRRRRWSASLPAFIAVMALTTCHSDSESAAPAVQAVSFDNSPVQGDTYELGETIQVMVRFDRAVTVTGTLRVALTVGTHTKQARYYASTTDGDLYFFYTVRADDRDADGIGIAANALSIDPGAVKDATGETDAVLTHPAVAADDRRKVDGSRVTAPRVINISYTHGPEPTRGDTYRLGERIQVLVTFDRAVRVTGVPEIALTVGTDTRQASFYPVRFIDLGSSVYFSYTVQREDRDADGISIPANALSLNDSAITLAGDAATDAVLIHSAVAADPDRQVRG